MRRSLIVLAALGVPGVLMDGTWNPCTALDLPPLRSEGAPAFTADLAISLDADASPGLSISLTIPFDELQWIRVPGGYGAAAEISVSFEPRHHGPGAGDAWERRVFVRGFDRTHSPQAVVQERRSFHLEPGPYDVRVTVQDENSKLVSRVHQGITVPDYSHVPVGFADLELGFLDEHGAFEEVPTRVFGRNSSHLAARAALFDRRAGSWPRVYSFHYRVLDDGGQELIGGQREVSVEHSAAPVVIRPDSASLFIGTYTFEVELDEGRSRWRVERSFEVEESGPPRGKDFDRMLEPLSYVALPQEIEALRALRPEEQAKGWDDFWRRRDPTPETPRNEAMLEFFRRVRYAETHFQHFGPGWRSDMGRIYIKFGAPDQIDSRAETAQTPQVETWTYNHPFRQFVFVDREGFGRFTLVTPTTE